MTKKKQPAAGPTKKPDAKKAESKKEKKNLHTVDDRQAWERNDAIELAQDESHLDDGDEENE